MYRLTQTRYIAWMRDTSKGALKVYVVTSRWLEIVSSTYILMIHYNHSLSIDATIMVSKNCKPLVNTLLSFS